MFGLGKHRTRFGQWLDRKGINQLDIEKKTGLSRGTISKACSDDSYSPKLETAHKILKAIKALTKESKEYDDFWSM